MCQLYLTHERSQHSVSTLRALEGLAPEWMALTTLLVADDDPASGPLQAAFHIRRLPSLVLLQPWPGLSRASLNLPPVLPFYGVIDDEAVLAEGGGSESPVRSLLQIMASATPTEWETALRTRRFRKLVWQAQVRAGVPMKYLQDLSLRFGSATAQWEVRFDERGWPTALD